MVATQTVPEADEYTIRRYRPNDREGFLALYEQVWNRRKDGDWFDWRFEQNPYTDTVEMAVAERDGDIVGAEPLLPFRLAAGDDAVMVRQPVDWIVHGDHRRRGLFTRMTEQLLESTTADTVLFFNFPTDALRAGLERFDWSDVGPVATRYRIQNPAGVIRSKQPETAKTGATLGRLGSPFARACLAVADLTAPTGGTDSVSRTPGVDVDAISTVYRDTRPSKLHVPRHRAFLEWRFANPNWETTTYVARDERDRPVATIVVAVETVADLTNARLLDIQPMETRPKRARAVSQLLGEIVHDYQHVDLLSAPHTPFSSLLRRYGFLRDDGVLLSRFSSHTTHVVRPTPDPSATTLLGADVTDPDAWCLTLADRDIE